LVCFFLLLLLVNIFCHKRIRRLFRSQRWIVQLRNEKQILPPHALRFFYSQFLPTKCVSSIWLTVTQAFDSSHFSGKHWKLCQFAFRHSLVKSIRHFVFDHWTSTNDNVWKHHCGELCCRIR
jgi:hypothetical protein